MQFQRLKLIGFKSFVDSSEFRIEPGLTGIVGPNGCGKSNLLEAMRWVMGATSAKAMRGAGMDDVIFAGSDKRPSRNWAEVSLSIDNSLGLAPQPFTDQLQLEVSRRIERGSGSTYRINGKEVRARDVQLLFADASTGANSPALVRQGQISELIAAKPQNRRRVLEEAGGVSGLHTRRHEAELRLKAAEANLARLDDISRELDQTLSRLKREARQAEKFKKIASEIRALQKAILYAKWMDAKAQYEALSETLKAVSSQVEALTKDVSEAQRHALGAFDAIAPLREEDAVAGTVVQRLTIEKERLDSDEKQAGAELARLDNEIKRLNADIDREQDLSLDGAVQMERLASLLERVREDIKMAPTNEPRLKAQLDEVEAKRLVLEAEVENRAAHLATLSEKQKAFEQRRSETNQRAAQARQRLEAARAELAKLPVMDANLLPETQARLCQAQDSLNQAMQERDGLELKLQDLQKSESAARQALRIKEDERGRLASEQSGLTKLLSVDPKAKTPVLASLRVEKGYELALAAALGDDLNLSTAPDHENDQLAFWNEAFNSEAKASDLSHIEGVLPLSQFIKAPQSLALRLSTIGLIESSRGHHAQKLLPHGARLVSLEGDLWRWDGVTIRAGAPKPAAVRLEQMGRCDAIAKSLSLLAPQLEEARQTLNEISQAIKADEAALKSLRASLPSFEQTVRQAQSSCDDVIRTKDRLDTQTRALSETIERLSVEDKAMQADVAQLEAQAHTPLDLSTEQQALLEARQKAEAIRLDVVNARSALSDEQRDAEARMGRERHLTRELSEWLKRTEESKQRIKALQELLSKTEVQFKSAQDMPEAFEKKRVSLVDSMALAQARLDKAREALQHGETEKLRLDQAVREGEKALAQLRETRAMHQAREEALGLRVQEFAATITEQTGLEPQALGHSLKAEAIAIPADTQGAESLLSGLERERDDLGAVNLRAQDEANEYQTRLEAISAECVDLTTAIAKLRRAIEDLNAEGRERLLNAFEVINGHFKTLFQALFGGGSAELRLIESDDPLEAGLEIYACPPGKRLSAMSLMSGGEQALTATALIFGVFLANPAPVCVLDEVDAPLDDANVDRYCRLLDEMRTRTQTRFIAITHNPVTMARMDRLFGVTMAERGVSQLVSVDLKQAESIIGVAV